MSSSNFSLRANASGDNFDRLWKSLVGTTPESQQQFVERLQSAIANIANKRLSGEARRLNSPEDIFASAAASVARVMRKPSSLEHQFDTADDLLAYFLVVASRKCAEKNRASAAKKRGGAATTVSLASLSSNDTDFEPASKQGRPEEEIELGDFIAELENLLDRLPVSELRIVRLYAAGLSTAEIAVELACSPRSVRRHIQTIVRTLSSQLDIELR